MTGAQRFAELIKAFSALIQFDGPDWILKGNPLDVDGVAFNVLYKNEDGERFFIYADFGPVPLGEEAEIFQTLLEANLALYRGNGPAFSLSRKTSRVLYGECHSLEKMTPEELADRLARLSMRAKKWRVDHVIEGIKSRSSSDRDAIARQMFKNIRVVSPS